MSLEGTHILEKLSGERDEYIPEHKKSSISESIRIRMRARLFEMTKGELGAPLPPAKSMKQVKEEVPETPQVQQISTPPSLPEKIYPFEELSPESTHMTETYSLTEIIPQLSTSLSHISVPQKQTLLECSTKKFIENVNNRTETFSLLENLRRPDIQSMYAPSTLKDILYHSSSFIPGCSLNELSLISSLLRQAFAKNKEIDKRAGNLASNIHSRSKQIFRTLSSHSQRTFEELLEINHVTSLSIKISAKPFYNNDPKAYSFIYALSTANKSKLFLYNSLIESLDTLTEQYGRIFALEDFKKMTNEYFIKFMRYCDFSDLTKKYYSKEINAEVRRRHAFMKDKELAELMYALCMWEKEELISTYKMPERFTGTQEKFHRSTLTLLVRVFHILSIPLSQTITEQFEDMCNAYQESQSTLEKRFDAIIEKFHLKDLTRNKICSLGFEMDFAVPSKKFNIEIDGHGIHVNKARDHFRDAILEKYGWEIMRIEKNKLDKLTDSEKLQKELRRELLFKKGLRPELPPSKGRIHTKQFAVERVPSFSQEDFE